MEYYVKIDATGLPAIYPTSYTDTLYTFNRVIADGIHQESFYTSKKFKTINDSFYRDRIIQSLVYNRYRIELYIDESINIQLLRLAEYVYITLKNETRHNAKILDITEENQSDTELRKCVITYADTNPENYRNAEDPVNNYMTKDSLLEIFTTVQLCKMIISSSVTIDNEFGFMDNTYTFYSKLRPNKQISKAEESNIKINSLEPLSKRAVQRQAVQRFYLTEYQSTIIEKYARICDSVRFESPTDGVYEGIEPVDIKVSEIDGAVRLFECDVTLKYDNLVFNPYNT